MNLSFATPAAIWRAFLFGTGAASALAAGPAPAPPANLAQVGLPDAAEAQRILEQFRSSGIAGSYYLEFDLHEIPRRAAETVLRGRLWGSRNGEGAVTRIAVVDATGAEHRLLLQNGPHAAVWRWSAGRAVPVDGEALFDPLLPGVELSAFDLQMPFLFWPDAKIVSINRILGRPAHAFMFRPPAEFAAKNPTASAVRSYFDAQFNAPTQTELLDAHGVVTKTLALLDLKKVGTQYIPKAFEVRDENTRNKTRLAVTAAALGLALPAEIFAPAALGGEAPQPDGAALKRFAP